ncbi:MAG: DUF1638 domain-containing protein [Planctomycetota bacterium]|jgi:hypothetical protein|nr:DUF1638 domain-containing protein [Planctomycetota bacterium]
MESQRLQLIACEVFTRELCAAVAGSSNQVDLKFLPKGLHSLGCQRMRSAIQDCIDAVPEGRYDAICLGFGLCNNGLAELRAGHTPLVMPRAHDCITLFLGSRQRYREQFDNNPGTYFLTSGWIERGDTDEQLQPLSVEHQTGLDLSYQDMVDKYGEDNAKFLYEQLNQTSNYGRYCYVEMGVEPDDRYQRETQRRADDKGWRCDTVRGDMDLLQRLLNGPWDDDFITVAPGQRIAASYDDRVVEAKP